MDSDSYNDAATYIDPTLGTDGDRHALSNYHPDAGTAARCLVERIRVQFAFPTEFVRYRRDVVRRNGRVGLVWSTATQALKREEHVRLNCLLTSGELQFRFLDFIALDGSISLSLHTDDSTLDPDSNTLTS
ncbi:MAG: hypothetical protein OXD46_13115, partial [Chloroflexi bacterium]|nr:hypothetical protein [Chloroflexota bacterium]